MLKTPRTNGANPDAPGARWALTGRSSFVYGSLFIAWVAVMGWQMLEHSRIKEAARTTLVNRARAITTSLGVVIRSQIRFGVMVSKDRLESALSDLAKIGEPKAIALLNASGAIVASAGEHIP